MFITDKQRADKNVVLLKYRGCLGNKAKLIVGGNALDLVNTSLPCFIKDCLEQITQRVFESC